MKTESVIYIRANGGYVPLSDDGLSVIGETKHVYDGWPIPREWTIECFCMEGPKIAKRGDYYYLTVAEGGTAGPATSHMIISARSNTPFGPWENSPYNPILRTNNNIERWWSKGHGTLFGRCKKVIGGLFFIVMKRDFIIWADRLCWNLLNGQKMDGTKYLKI